MDFKFTEEQEMLARSVERFARQEVAPGADQRDETGEWNWELWRKIGEIGLLGLPIPEEYGGSGASAVTSLLAYEAFCRGGRDAGLYLSVGAHVFLCAVPIWLHGTEEQKKKFLPKLCSGEYVGALALTEPNAGSDAAGIQTTARREGDYYVLNGSKMFITNGSIADVILVMATLDRSKRAQGVTAFIVEKGTPGFSVSRELNKMGHRSSPTAELVFEDCRVPVDNRLGDEGRGFQVTTDTLVWERGVFLAAESIGLMEAILEMTLEYAKQRIQFGKPIAEFQMIREKLANMQITLDAAKLLSYRAAWMKDEGLDGKFEASVAKGFYADQLVRMAEDALQIFGGYGYMKEYPIERIYRDAKLMTIGGGTSEVQKLVISSKLIRA
ncbi:acyl-CoA dehydrogenase family protein [Calderihabitans maritimus]|uniref:Acyl-CoA dehydrogenase n=1 Tax=Calderihabitans maritimus TaxID=1246530 RepID=A0A1Z5HXD4_9FIRM|nr:acyl-CoA dehydrogenase family protein [Calderihabitans maritimus]GAW93940.1 acyl-CoA dehydrogenase [Calderihabitans maritimus]